VKLNSAFFSYSLICIYIFLERKVGLEAASDLEARVERDFKRKMLLKEIHTYLFLISG